MRSFTLVRSIGRGSHWRYLALLVSLIGLSGLPSCTGVPNIERLKAYDGPDLPVHKVAVIKGSKNARYSEVVEKDKIASIERIDGKALPVPKAVREFIEGSKHHSHYDAMVDCVTQSPCLWRWVGTNIEILPGFHTVDYQYYDAFCLLDLCNTTARKGTLRFLAEAGHV